MTTNEGVIKFQLRHRPGRGGFGPATGRALAELGVWRRRLWQLELIGQQPGRYGGAGFGNLSTRLGAGPSFVVTATQTGGRPALTPAEHVEVADWSIDENWVRSFGPTKPSSEALTHAAIYGAAPTVRFVFHVHAPAIWHARDELELLRTPPVDYGTKEMARALEGFARSAAARGKIIAMPAHEDGLICFGRTADEAGLPLIELSARQAGL